MSAADPHTVGNPDILLSADAHTSLAADPDALSAADPHTVGNPHTLLTADPDAVLSADAHTVSAADPDAVFKQWPVNRQKGEGAALSGGFDDRHSVPPAFKGRFERM
ncbi:hypothetical protein ACWDKQ_02045 [Saccharopolyspora sp. NPDC000995]